VLDVLEMPEAMRCMLLCMLEAVEGRLCLLDVLEVPDVMCCVLRCLLKALDVLEMPEVMRCMLLYMLEAVEGELCLLEVLDVMRCVLLRMPLRMLVLWSFRNFDGGSLLVTVRHLPLRHHARSTHFCFVTPATSIDLPVLSYYVTFCILNVGKSLKWLSRSRPWMSYSSTRTAKRVALPKSDFFISTMFTMSTRLPPSQSEG